MTDPHAETSQQDAESYCPGCNHTITPEQVLCVECGFHLVEKRYIQSAFGESLGADAATSSPGDEAPTTPTDWKARPGQQQDPDSEIAAVDPSNPFSPPQPLVSASKEPPKPELLDMDLELAHELRFVVSEWRWIFVALICSLFGCLPIPLLMFPWYTYKAYLWYRLYHKHETLQNPNSFAAFGTLAAEFKDSRKPILAGIAIGFVMWCLMVIVGVTWPR